MTEFSATYGSLTFDAAHTEVALAVDLQDGRSSIRLTSYGDPVMLYVDGTLDELAKLVADLAGVVRELTARELSVVDAEKYGESEDVERARNANYRWARKPGTLPPFDGTVAPVAAVINALRKTDG